MKSGSKNKRAFSLPKQIGDLGILFFKRQSHFSTFYFEIEDQVNQTFAKWMRSAIKDLKEHEGQIPVYDPSLTQDLSFYRLTGNPTWDQMKPSFLSAENLILAKNHKALIGMNHSYFITSNSKELLFAIGYRISPSYILEEAGHFLTSTFDAVVEEKGVKLGEQPCVILSYEKETQECFAAVFQPKPFEFLFDLHEHKLKIANAFIGTHLSKLVDPEIAKAAVFGSKRTLNLLSKPFILEGNLNTEPSYLEKVKAGDPKLAFDVQNGQIVLPKDKAQQDAAVRDLIKAISHHFTQTLDGNHIIEGIPVRVVS